MSVENRDIEVDLDIQDVPENQEESSLADILEKCRKCLMNEEDFKVAPIEFWEEIMGTMISVSESNGKKMEQAKISANDKKVFTNNFNSLLALVKVMNNKLIACGSEPIQPNKDEVILQLAKESNDRSYIDALPVREKVPRTNNKKNNTRGFIYKQPAAKKCCSGFIRTANLLPEIKSEIADYINKSGKAYAYERPTGVPFQTACTCKGKSENCEALLIVEYMKSQYNGLSQDHARVNTPMMPRIQISVTDPRADFDTVSRMIPGELKEYAEQITFLRLVAERVNRRGNAKIFIVEVNPITRNILSGLNIKLTDARVYIRDTILVRFCTKCEKYGHSHTHCRTKFDKPIIATTIVPVSPGGSQIAQSNADPPSTPRGFYPNPPQEQPQAQSPVRTDQQRVEQVNKEPLKCKKCHNGHEHHPLSLFCYHRYKYASTRVALINYGETSNCKITLWEL